MFVGTCVIEAADEKEAMNLTVDHLLKHGGAVTLMPGAPEIPVAIVAAIPIRVDALSSIVQTSHLPKVGVN